jgi:hypothetical protein
MDEIKRGFGEARRREAKKALLALAKSFGVREGKQRLVAQFSLVTGHTPKRIEMYLDELVQAGLIVVEGDEIGIAQAAATKEEEERHDR